MSHDALRKIGLIFLIITSGFAALQRCIAEGTNAVIPYSVVEKLLRASDEADPKKLVAQVRITSRNAKSSDMHLTIQSPSSGVIPVKLGAAGELLDFPRNEGLHREDPPIFTDQPKGTVWVSLYSEVPVPAGLMFPYSRLAEGVAEAKKLTKAQAGMLSALAPSPQAVVFVFPKASVGKAKVEIVTGKERKEWIADTNGFVKLTLEKSLVKENPPVRLSEKVQHIFPASE